MKGYGISLGLATEKVFVLQRDEVQARPSVKKSEKSEIADRIKRALFYAAEEYVSLKNNLISKVSDNELKMLDLYIGILQEPEFIKSVAELMVQNSFQPENAVISVYNQVQDSMIFLNSDGLCKNMDIKSMGLMVSNIYHRLESTILPGGDEKFIIVGEHLPFYLFSGIDTSRIAGVITEKGSESSHSAVLLRSLSIPAVFGVDNILQQVKTGDWAMIDGESGEVILSRHKIEPLELSGSEEKNQRKKDCITKDGKIIKLMGNVSSLQEAENLSKNSKYGAGLVRTEFLFIDHTDIPMYYQQISKYLQIKKACASDIVIYRLFDITSEKKSFLSEVFDFDKNCLIETQIRALLNLYCSSTLYLLIPNVRYKDEIIAVRKMIIHVQNELIKHHLPGAKKIRLGIMIETVDIAERLDDVIDVIDFAAIGTNDLSADYFGYKRGEAHQSLYFFEPKFLSFIKNIIDKVQGHHKLIYTCGAASRTREGALILCALGLDTLSMSPSSIPAIKKFLASIDLTLAKKEVEHLLCCANAEELMDRLIDLIYN